MAGDSYHLGKNLTSDGQSTHWENCFHQLATSALVDASSNDETAAYEVQTNKDIRKISHPEQPLMLQSGRSYPSVADHALRIGRHLRYVHSRIAIPQQASPTPFAFAHSPSTTSIT
jgi:hypothetical protein